MSAVYLTPNPYSSSFARYAAKSSRVAPVKTSWSQLSWLWRYALSFSPTGEGTDPRHPGMRSRLPSMPASIMTAPAPPSYDIERTIRETALTKG